MPKLANKVALITGATSGMALAAAKLFVEEGAYVFITGRRQAALDAAVQAIGQHVRGVCCDSANLADLDHLVEVVKREKDRVDVLYASAGFANPGPMLGAITEKEFANNFNTNTKGTLFTVQKLLPLLSDGASVLMTGTMANTKAIPGLSVYAASKTALVQFARVWSLELKDRKIRFNVLNPGPIDTALMAGISPEDRTAYAKQVPFDRLGKPQDIAAIALFLASDEASFITGQEINVDGGMGLT